MKKLSKMKIKLLNSKRKRYSQNKNRKKMFNNIRIHHKMLKNKKNYNKTLFKLKKIISSYPNISLKIIKKKNRNLN